MSEKGSEGPKISDTERRTKIAEILGNTQRKESDDPGAQTVSKRPKFHGIEDPNFNDQRTPPPEIHDIEKTGKLPPKPDRAEPSKSIKDSLQKARNNIAGANERIARLDKMQSEIPDDSEKSE